MPCPFADTAADAMPSRDAIRAYLEAHNIEGVLSHAVNASVKNKAADPIQFIISHLASQSEPTNSDVDFAAVRRELLLLMDNPQWDDGSLAPIFIRLAWHSSGTFDRASGTGGSSGAGMRFEYEASDPENAGLATVHVASLTHHGPLRPILHQTCTRWTWFRHPFCLPGAPQAPGQEREPRV